MTRIPSLRWTIISSAEQRAGRYTIVADWTDEEIRVLIDGKHLSHGFASIADAKAYCATHHQGFVAGKAMLASARHMTPTDMED